MSWKLMNAIGATNNNSCWMNCSTGESSMSNRSQIHRDEIFPQATKSPGANRNWQ
jgi:hypothetical protein